MQQQNQQHVAAFPQQHQQQALEIVDKIRVALEESNNTYIQRWRYIQTYFYDVQQQNQQHVAAFPQQHQQQALEIVDKIRVALEESNNTYIQRFKSIHQIESEIEQNTGQSIETI